MKAPKVNAQKIMYIAAIQIVLTTVGFIMYKRPYLWAWTSLKYYKDVVCGSNLDTINGRMRLEDHKHQMLLKSKVDRYNAQCNEHYLRSFSDLYHESCMMNAKPAFVQIPLATTFLCIGIVACLQWFPYHKKSLKKPGFICAFFLSLVLVAMNIGQIISLIIPIINPDASPNRGAASDTPCGTEAEVVALFLIVGSTILSGAIALFVIRLYAFRAKYQDKHEKDLRMRGKHEESSEDEDYEQNSRSEKMIKKEKNPSAGRRQHQGHIPMAGAQGTRGMTNQWE